MALLFETPFPYTDDQNRRFNTARLISTASGSYELQNFCLRQGIPRYAITDSVLHLRGRQIEAARYAGAREVTPQQLDKIIRSKTNG